MKYVDTISRRTMLAGAGSLIGLSLAGCATTASPLARADAHTSRTVAVPANVASMYAALVDGGFAIRASRMDLVPERFWRRQVADPTGELPGSVVVDTRNHFLYHVGENGTATRYGVGIGAAGFEWSGRAHIAYKRAWPRWTPPAEMINRQPELERYRQGMEPGPDNPLGPRALYIHQGNVDTLYRIHGNSDERTIGLSVSSGCVRMLPQDVIHLSESVTSGAPLVVTALAS